jgi:hypothetical protein
MFKMQQFLDLVGKNLDLNTSKIVASYTFSDTLTSDDVHFLTGEWESINNITCYAAANGLLNVLKWAHEHKVTLTWETCAIAASAGGMNGHVHMLLKKEIWIF